MDEIVPSGKRLMDLVQLMSAFAVGAGGLLTLQKLIERLRSEPQDKQVSNGERRIILRELAGIQQGMVNQDAAIERLEGRMDGFSDRLRAAERNVDRWPGQGSSKQGNTD